MFKVLSWNIRQGGASRRSKIVDRIINFKPAIIVLSEFRNNDHGSFIRSKLLKSGYRFQTVSGAKSEDNSVLIASTLECDSNLYGDKELAFRHNIIHCEFEAFNILGAYLPHKKKHNLFEKLHDISQLDKPGILTGDFNTGINGVDQKGNSFWYEDDLVKFTKNGYSDAFRHIYKDKIEYSWFSHQGNGYRYDHFYISNDLLPLVKDCYYLHDWREEGLSDHSPMVLELG